MFYILSFKKKVEAIEESFICAKFDFKPSKAKIYPFFDNSKFQTNFFYLIVKLAAIIVKRA